MKKSEAKHIVNYLKENQDSMILFLKKLVEAESPSTDANAQVKIINLLKSALEELNYYVLYIPGKKTGGYLFARPHDRLKNDPIQLMLGHCDTVWKTNTIKEMPITHDSFKITGPGIFDMKAGLTQMIYSLRAIRDLKLNCFLTPVIIINSDEEIGSRESTNTIKNISKITKRAFVLEPPLGLEGKLKTARKGIGRFTLAVRGKPAHAGLNPDKGVSAIVELSYHIQHLFSLNDFEKGITVNVGMIEGGTSANVIAAESSAVIDVRVHNNKDAEFISKEILSLKPVNKDIDLLVNGYFGRPPMERTDRNQRLWKMAKNLGELIGLELEESTAGGGSDGNTTSLFTATLDGLGTIGGGAHAKHEFIYTDKLIERTALLTLLLIEKPIRENNV
ncbi:MAG: M20 family metallopeptidase [Bacteroidota bacterium]